MAFAWPVENEEQVKKHLAELRQQHHSARHHCYAWRLGPQNGLSRSSDDGEPSGSAGKPILNQIVVHNLHQVLVVVVRYFGGTLLGVSGLVNAYREAAASALGQASVTEKFLVQTCKVSFVSEDLSAVMRVLKDNQAKIMRETYESRHEIVFTVRKGQLRELEARMQALYRTEIEQLTPAT